MSAWFSEYRVGVITRHIAPQLMPRVQMAVHAALKQIIDDELPGMLREALRHEIPELVAKRSPSGQRDRNAAIRARYNGHNAKSLAHEFGISIRQIMRIAALK